MLQIEYLNNEEILFETCISKAMIDLSNISYITSQTVDNTAHVVIGIGGREFILTSSSASKIFEAMNITKDDVLYYGRYSYIQQ